MTRRQAENLAKGNPKVAERLAAGDYELSGDSPGGPREKPRAPREKKPARKTVSAGAPPGRPRARSGSPRGSSGGKTRAPRRSRDNGQPDPEKPRGLFRSILDGLFDI